ncbi:MAG: RnfABCDGE type electron transport complex subunit B [Spirochaetota bacterium]
MLPAISLMFLLGALSGWLLAFSKRKFRPPGDECAEALEAALPSLDCGACGFPGCAGYARALSSKETVDLALCPPGGNETAAALAQILGQDAVEVPAEVAFVQCQGSPEYAKADFVYQGLEDCQAAAQLFQGSKSCSYGCIGLGSCIKQCPVDAIHISADSLAVVDPEQCVGCRKCIPVCPTQVIRMIPKNAPYAVICNALDHGKITRNNCKVGCIGCRVCERMYPDLGFKVQDNLARVDYPFIEEKIKAHSGKTGAVSVGNGGAAGAETDVETDDGAAQLAQTIQKCPSQCIVALGKTQERLPSTPDAQAAQAAKVAKGKRETQT